MFAYNGAQERPSEHRGELSGVLPSKGGESVEIEMVIAITKLVLAIVALIRVLAELLRIIIKKTR
jgi:hypothetical protein